MSKMNYYVVTRPQGGWAVKKGGSSKASVITNTQSLAIQLGKALAKKDQGELTIQGKNHKFSEKNIYGNDPKNIKG